MPTKREVLAVLSRDDLLTCLDQVGLEVRDRRVRDNLVHVLMLTGAPPPPDAKKSTEFFCAGADIEMLQNAFCFKYEGAL